MKPLKIAVVDDDQIYQFIINRTITKLYPDSKILNFSNCADFYNFVKRNITDTTLLPDLVLLDLNTPFMNGWEFLESYKGLSVEKPMEVFLITSSVDPSDQTRAKDHPVLKGFFSKPLAPEQLLEIIEGVSVKHS